MTQWFRGSVVMRQWALDHVDEYALVVGPRLSGVDPEHPDLVGATVRLMSIPVHTVAGAIASGDLVPDAFPAAVTQLATGVPEPGPGVTVEARAIATGAVSALVGAVSLEAFGHLTGRRPGRRLRRLLAPGDAGHGVHRHPRTTTGWRSRPPEPSYAALVAVGRTRPADEKKSFAKRSAQVGGGGAHFHRRPQIAFG